MKILVCSCDKNRDLWMPFQHCMEKYWADHPSIVYSTESVVNPYYPTICKDYPLSQWSNRIRDTLAEMNDRAVLVMVDDIFIRRPVDKLRIADAENRLKGNIALMNFELTYLPTESIGGGWGKMAKGSRWAVSIMCGLWDRQKLMDVLDDNMTPWEVEDLQSTHGYDYCINTGDFIIDWGYRSFHEVGLFRGKWCREVVPFFNAEGIYIDYTLRGFYR